MLVGRWFGGLLAPRGAAGEPRLAAMIVDPGQIDTGAGMPARLGALWGLLDDPAAKPKFDALLQAPGMRTLLGPRMVTNGVADPQGYSRDIRPYTSTAWRREHFSQGAKPHTAALSHVYSPRCRKWALRQRSVAFARSEHYKTRFARCMRLF